MKLKQFAIAFMLCLFMFSSNCQTTEEKISLCSENLNPVIQKNFPALYSILIYEKSKDTTIKGIYYGDFSLFMNTGLATFATDKKYIFIDQNLILENNSQEYCNKVLWSFYEDLGTIHYWKLANKLDLFASEKYKNIFALKKAFALADNGNCGVLKYGINELNKKNEGLKSQERSSAIKEILESKTFSDYKTKSDNCLDKMPKKVPQNNSTEISAKVNMKSDNKYIPPPTESPAPPKKNNTTTKPLVKQDNNIKNGLTKREMKEFRIEYDAVMEVTTYYYKQSPKYNDKNNVMIYLNKYKNDTLELWLRVQVYYLNEEFKLQPHFYLKTDKELYDFSGEKDSRWYYYEGDEDYPGYCNGYFDTPVTSEILIALNEIVDSNIKTIRCFGEFDDYKDREISEKEIEGIKQVLHLLSNMPAD